MRGRGTNRVGNILVEVPGNSWSLGVLVRDCCTGGSTKHSGVQLGLLELILPHCFFCNSWLGPSLLGCRGPPAHSLRRKRERTNRAGWAGGTFYGQSLRSRERTVANREIMRNRTQVAWCPGQHAGSSAGRLGKSGCPTLGISSVAQAYILRMRNQTCTYPLGASLEGCLGVPVVSDSENPG